MNYHKKTSPKALILNTIQRGKKICENHGNQFLKFLKPFSVVKRFQNSKNTLEVLKNQNRGTLSHTPRAFNPVHIPIVI